MSLTNTERQELVSEDVRVHVDRKPACKIELSVKTSPSMLKKAKKMALKAVAKEVALPGFRQGRAPEEFILKKFPHDVERQVHKIIADLAFVAAQELVKIPVLNNNPPIYFDLKSQSVEEGATLTFSFETKPHIPSVNPTGFQAKPVDRPEVGEKQLEEAIRQMRFFYAQWKPVFERPIQDGDYIMINLDTIEGGIAQQVFHHVRFEVSSERMASWMKKLVQNGKSGDILEGTSEPDDTATAAEKEEFKPKQVRITILKVEEAALPELDDEFAKKVGATNIAQMRESISNMLNKQADEKAETTIRGQVNDFLIEHYAFDLPHSLIAAEEKYRHAQLMQAPNFKSDWEKMSQPDRKKFEDNLSNESSQAVRLFYLSRQIVEDAKIPITHKEIQEEAVAIYQQDVGRHAEVDKIPKEIFALALSKITLIKAQDYVIRAGKA